MKSEHIAQPKRGAWVDILLMGIFITLLWLPTVDFITGIDVTTPPGENRMPAPKPHFERKSMEGVQRLAVETENYFNDHFGFRKRLIRWCLQWKARLYSDQSCYKVVVGQHGWLYTGELQMVEHFLGIAKFTESQLQSWQKLFEKRRDWLAARGIKYLVVIPPDKHTIYPEELPAWLQNATRADRVTKLDQFLSYMKEHSTVNVVDLRQPLFEAKKIAPTYLQNDTHWNLFGGFAASRKIIKKLSEYFPDLIPLRLEDFAWTNEPAVGGDMSRMLGLHPAEKNCFVFKPGPRLPMLAKNENLAYKSNWGTKLVVSVENSSRNRRKLVVFNDSFGIALYDFLGYSFSRAVFEGDDHEFCQPLILSNNADAVINEIVEKNFNVMDPNEMMKMDALP